MDKSRIHLGGISILTALVVATMVVIPADAKSPRGSRANPILFGKTARLTDGWVVKVNKTIPTAWPLVHRENSYNDPPKAGRTFFMARLVATYRGGKARDSISTADFKAVGRSNVSYSTFEEDCGVVPGELSSKDVFQGGTISGYVCWQVKKSDLRSLQMYWEETFGDKVVFFALR